LVVVTGCIYQTPGKVQIISVLTKKSYYVYILEF